TFLSQLAGGLASGLVGDNTQAVASGADIAKRAVENNYLSASDWKDYESRIKSCGYDSDCIKQVREKYSEINKKNSLNLKLACQLGGSTKECSEHTESARLGFEYARENISFDHSGWMSAMMRTGKKESDRKPTDALVGSEELHKFEKRLSNPQFRQKLESDPALRKEVSERVDSYANAVRTEQGNAYEFGAKFQYPNISSVENVVGGYKVFGKEIPLEPVYPEAYIYGGLATAKGGKTLFDLASTSTKWTVGVNGAVSATAQYLKDGEISTKETLKDMGEAYITKDFGFKKFVGWNLSTGFIEGGLENTTWKDGIPQGFSFENGLERAGSKVVASSAGYIVGKKVESYANSKLNTFGESLKTEPIYPGSYIFKYKEPHSLPTAFGNIADGVFNGVIQDQWEVYKLINGKKDEETKK
ncbi:VENN motif pre-toxin domain-containing protein, partial [Ursidibacter arcticus]